ncbi:TMBIM6 [Scenedesmus sp. PABB004]|nr:TMBIM6 [Scenedesmus sp. PABB004]
MDLYNRLTGRTGFNASPATLLKMTDLDPRVQKHLSKVYATLTLAAGVAALGVAADLALHVGGVLTGLASLVSLIWLGFTPSTPDTLNKRYALLATFAFCQGTSLGGLVGLALALNPGILLTACLATVAVFGCFTLSALFTRRRSYLFLGGWLSSAVLGLFVLRLGSWVFRGLGGVALDAELYLGLLVFSGYVLFDTQLIVERASSAGDADHVRHALDLFVDAYAILTRVLVVLLRSQEKREREEARRKRRD